MINVLLLTPANILDFDLPVSLFVSGVEKEIPELLSFPTSANADYWYQYLHRFRQGIMLDG